MKSIRKLICIVVMLISFVALIYPSRKATATCLPQCERCVFAKSSCTNTASAMRQYCLNDGGYAVTCWYIYNETYYLCMYDEDCL